MNNKTLVFIDAGFLSKLSKHLGNGEYIIYDLYKFSYNFSKNENFILEKIYYYNAPPFISNNPINQEIIRKEKYDRFINKLKLNSIFEIREGRCQRLKLNNGQFEYNQKGVDTLLTMDLISIPIKYPKIKNIILIACDSDFVPVIKQLNQYNVKTILYTYYQKERKKYLSTSNQLFQVVFKYVLISKEDFLNANLD